LTTQKASAPLRTYITSAVGILQAEMDSLAEQMKLEREAFEKTQEEQKVVRERTMADAAVHIQTSFRAYR